MQYLIEEIAIIYSDKIFYCNKTNQYYDRFKTLNV